MERFLGKKKFQTYLIVAEAVAVGDAHQTGRSVSHRVEALLVGRIP